jgi:hypothetical protein
MARRLPRRPKRGPARALALAWLVAALPLGVSACCGRALRDGEPLHDAVDARRYLARPLSGAPDLGHPHVFGPGAVVAAGQPVRIESLAALDHGFRIRFSGPDACQPHCTLRLRPEGNQSPEDAFDAIFTRRDPLAALPDPIRDHVASHRIEAGMPGEAVRLALGLPDRIETAEYLGSPAERWHYERRVPEGRYRWGRSPVLALVVAADRVVDYEIFGAITAAPAPPHARGPEG